MLLQGLLLLQIPVLMGLDKKLGYAARFLMSDFLQRFNFDCVDTEVLY